MTVSRNDILIDIISQVTGNIIGKKAKKEAGTLFSFFENYYGGKAKGADETRPDILNWQISEIIEKEDFAAKVLDGIKSYPKEKYTLAYRLEKLFKYLHDNFGIEMLSLDNFKYRDKTNGF